MSIFKFMKNIFHIWKVWIVGNNIFFSHNKNEKEKVCNAKMGQIFYFLLFENKIDL
jgi:hypothetical protein